MSKILSSIFGSPGQRYVRKALGRAVSIIRASDEMSGLDDAALLTASQGLGRRLGLGVPASELLPEAFALVHQAVYRTLGLSAYPEQVAGAIALHDGRVAELQTGEGKTVVALFAAYLRSLEGKGVHVVTVNDYLARRDAETCRRALALLGVSVGVVYAGQDKEEKRQAYQCDVTYGTNNEFGFDYLRDNLALDPDQLCQRPLHAAILDEVDNILIDEARTPLIVSGPDNEAADLYPAVNTLAPRLVRQEDEDAEGDFHLDPKRRRVMLSEVGQLHADALFQEAGLIQAQEGYGHRYLLLLHHLHAALLAHHAYHRDQDYVVRDGKVVIVDEFTGRAIEKRRWSAGLHQAIEAKEGVDIEAEDRVRGSVTLQNYFRAYPHLSGMTGTAATEKEEFDKIYGLRVVVMPTHKPMIRKDHDDQVFLTRSAADTAIVKHIKMANDRGQPVLVGTPTVAASEHLSDRLTQAGLPHQVLNATRHADEARIIAQAGRPGAITLATNMAGRGTDIVLGGAPPDTGPTEAIDTYEQWQARHDQVVKAGGLLVLGTARHESRRIDHQLRGRAGRQGDPGDSCFFLSLEDHLLKTFMPAWSRQALERAGAREDMPVAASIVSRQVQAAQKKIEGFHADQRRSLLDYDGVLAQQRQALYDHRRVLLHASLDELRGQAMEAIQEIDRESGVPGLVDRLRQDLAGMDGDRQHVYLRHAILKALDGGWQDLMQSLDYLRAGIHLRALAQKPPLQEYRREAFELFTQMSRALSARIADELFSDEAEEKA